MALRYLLGYATLTIGHALVSFVAILSMVAESDSGLYYFMFFPLLLLERAGAGLPSFESVVPIVVNSPSWAAIVLAVWIVGARSIGKWRQGVRRGERTKGP